MQRSKEKSKKENAKGLKDWSNDEVSMLINLLEENPCLWDVFQKAYSKHDEIADTELESPLDTATDSVKTKINGLRAQLGRELDKVNKIKSDQSTNELYTSS